MSSAKCRPGEDEWINYKVTNYCHKITFYSLCMIMDRCRQPHADITKRNIWLQWRHNDPDGVWNHQPHGCLLNRLFRRRSKKTSKLRVTGLCVENSAGSVNSPHEGLVTRKMFPFDDVIMYVYVSSNKFGTPRDHVHRNTLTCIMQW